MSDLTIILIALVGFGAGFIGGYAIALMNYHKRRPMSRGGEGWNG